MKNSITSQRIRFAMHALAAVTPTLITQLYESGRLERPRSRPVQATGTSFIVAVGLPLFLRRRRVITAAAIYRLDA